MPHTVDKEARRSNHRSRKILQENPQSTAPGTSLQNRLCRMALDAFVASPQGSECPAEEANRLLAKFHDRPLRFSWV